MKFRDIEITKGKGIALSIYRSLQDNCTAKFGIHFEIPWLINAFIPVYRGTRQYPYDAEMWASWGFTTHNADSIHLNWGERCKVLRLPWSWEWVRTSRRLSNGLWHHEKEGSRLNFEQRSALPTWNETHEFRYVMNSGEIQDRKATVKVSEREWRLRWFKWLPFIKKVRRTISVDFDKEVGEESGSWKGGTLGCGYDLKPGETPEQCLRRMESDRAFFAR